LSVTTSVVAPIVSSGFWCSVVASVVSVIVYFFFEHNSDSFVAKPSSIQSPNGIISISSVVESDQRMLLFDINVSNSTKTVKKFFDIGGPCVPGKVV
jgi:hypothetical protein